MKRIIILVLCFWSFLFHPAVQAGIEFSCRFAGQQTVDGMNALAVTFSEPLDTTLNPDRYFSIRTADGESPEGSWIISKDPQVAYFSNIKADTGYVVTIRKGLKAASKRVLKTGQEYTIKTRPVRPMISFGSTGFILASKLNSGLPVNALNIDKADVDFFRIKPEFLDEFRRQFGNIDSMAYYMNDRLQKCTDLVYSGRWEFDVKKDLRTAVNLPITHIKALSVPGIYFAVLKGAGQYTYRNSSIWFSISDLGLHARKYHNRLEFYVQNLETAGPVQGVWIKGYKKDGERLFNIITDENGIARFNGAADPVKYVLARSKKSITYLPMDMPALDLSEFRTAVEPFRPVELFVYGPRDLYRPGENVVIDGLLRDYDGKMTAGLPIAAEIIRPGGRVIYEFQWKSHDLNHYHYEYRLSSNAVTGQWRIRFKQGGNALKEYRFIVADFLPERMKLQAGPGKNGQYILNASDTPILKLKGDFLYGAPAAGVRADAMIHLKPARKLFKEKWPGYEFGDATDTFKRSWKTKSIVLDKEGKGDLVIQNEWKKTRSVSWLTANASIYDSGGRPVVRNTSWQIWPAEQLTGIRLLSEDDTVKSNSAARFEIIVVNKQGERIKAGPLKAVVIKEHREYFWEFRNDIWQWHYTSQFYPVDRFDVDLPDKGAAVVSVPVKWGGYRLEIKDPKTHLVSSVSFRAGWQPDGMADGENGSRPDRVDLSLDKPAYLPSDIAKLSIKAPQAGSGYVFVESDTNLLTLPVDVPARGKTIDIPIDPSWNRHDLYISAIIIKKGDSGSKTLPKRAVGLIHLPLDRSQRKLSLEIDLPEKTEPNRNLEVQVDVKRADGTAAGHAFVTLAAVDVGVLNLTGFKTPSAFDYFFQDRKYLIQMHDVYQKLIEANKGAWARQRFGGDMPGLTRGGEKPSTDVQIVCLFENAVETDENGKAVFTLALPEFNGSLRVMAVAHTGSAYGSLDREMVVASPLVAQITMPRFLAMGDKSRVAIDIHNLTKTSQQLDLNLDISGPVRALEKTRYRLNLDPDEKTTLVFPVFSQARLGKSNLRLSIQGIEVDGEKRTMEQTWFLDTRPAYPARTSVFRSRLKKGQAFEIRPSLMNTLLKETIGVQAVLSSFPPINILDHIQELNAYPYGCLEQTTSGIFPFVILSASDISALGLSGQTDKKTREKVELGIQRLMEKQKSSGGFGLWSANSHESYWLTAYVVDFLLHARQAGYAVPPKALSRALERLKIYVKRPGAIQPEYYMDKDHYRAAARAYAAFVLARVQAVSLGDARALYHSIESELKGRLGWVHAGLALYLSGDQTLGTRVIREALTGSRERQGDIYYGDYGSGIRDLSMSYFLVSNFYPGFNQGFDFLTGLQEKLDQRQWLSTQERNALVLAGSVALKNKGKTWQADIRTGGRNKTISHDQQQQFISLNGEASSGFKIVNTAGTDLFTAVTLTGYPAQRPEPEAKGIQISRRFLTLDGKSVATHRFTSGDRLIAQLSFTAEKRMPNGLLVDLLPACLELEDPNLAGSVEIDSIVVDGKSIGQWQKTIDIRHTEYRDDRFAAAVNIPAKEAVRIFYPVRVVSPGEYLIPPPLAEDMYRPGIRAVGDCDPLMQVDLPGK